MGEKTKAAGEYHSADFEFLEHKAAVDEELARDASAYHVAEGVGESMWTPCSHCMACDCQFCNPHPIYMDIKEHASLQGQRSSQLWQKMRYGRHSMQGTMLQHASIRREGELEPHSLQSPEVQQCACAQCACARCENLHPHRLPVLADSQT